jgi:cycloeucalenol cycloisomerase
VHTRTSHNTNNQTTKTAGVRTRSSSGAAAATGKAGSGSTQKSLWLAADPSKRWAEVFYLAYSPFWIIWALCVLVPFQLYEVGVPERRRGLFFWPAGRRRRGRLDTLQSHGNHALHTFPLASHHYSPTTKQHLDAWGYLLVGLAAAVPCFALPPLLVPRTAPPAVTRLPWHQQFWVKANLWVLIFGYVGNYFWTHYFYQLLGAAYTIPSFELNAVPLPMYLMTHAYFLFYHALSNVVLRRVENALAGSSLAARKAARAAAVFALAYATAYGETLTIAHVRLLVVFVFSLPLPLCGCLLCCALVPTNTLTSKPTCLHPHSPCIKTYTTHDVQKKQFPYYTFVDRAKMYTVGSLFYALYFFVSFPMFMRLDEDAPGPRARRWTLPQVKMDADRDA